MNKARLRELNKVKCFSLCMYDYIRTKPENKGECRMNENIMKEKPMEGRTVRGGSE